MLDAEVLYYPQFLSQYKADNLLKYFIEALKWEQSIIRLYGRDVRIPRLQAWYGDNEANYRYSNLDMQPLPWDDKLHTLKIKCEAQAKCQFNSVLANYYRNGQDSMGMHSDDEPELGPEPTIASLSFGQTRRFVFQHKETKETQRIDLEHGSLLVMSGPTQRKWKHGINKSKTHTGQRINLTFRQILQS